MKLTLNRYRNNPILCPTANSWENKFVFNCGVAEYENKILLIYRAQGDDKISRLGLATTSDGFQINERLTEPIFSPDPDSEYEALGVEDPRITKIDDTYFITYTAASTYPEIFKEETSHDVGSFPWRVRVSIAHTHDFKTFTRHGVVISHIDSKDAALFPEKINGQFLLIHRVIPDIRLAVGNNLTQFQERGPIISPRKTGWDVERVGIGAQPIKTPFGWLIIYHGTSRGRTSYSLGLALLDLKDPSVVLGRSDDPIFEPNASYERLGNVNNVVFTCGAIVWQKQLLVYYGGADEVIGVASISYSHVLAWAKHQHDKATHRHR